MLFYMLLNLSEKVKKKKKFNKFLEAGVELLMQGILNPT